MGTAPFGSDLQFGLMVIGTIAAIVVFVLTRDWFRARRNAAARKHFTDAYVRPTPREEALMKGAAEPLDMRGQLGTPYFFPASAGMPPPTAWSAAGFDPQEFGRIEQRDETVIIADRDFAEVDDTESMASTVDVFGTASAFHTATKDEPGAGIAVDMTEQEVERVVPLNEFWQGLDEKDIVYRPITNADGKVIGEWLDGTIVRTVVNEKIIGDIPSECWTRHARRHYALEMG